MKAIVIIPTYNEKENIESIINTVFNVNKDVNVLIIDDNSPDGTADIVKKMQKSDNRIHLIQRPGKMGLGTAYLDGFKYCLENNYDAIMEMDADFSHNPEVINNFLIEIQNYDVVIGSRYINGVNVVNWPLRRLFLSKGASLYTRIITGMPIQDPTAGFKCLRADALRRIDLDKVKTNGYGFQIEMHYRMWKSGAKIKEIPIVFIDRRSGVSKMNRKIIFEAILMVWKLKFCVTKKNVLKKN